MIEKIKQILMDEKYCVLATAMNNKPHCSLMAYCIDEDCKKLYMVTDKDSDKYRNLQANGIVSLMIDTRSSDIGKTAKALTVNGSFKPINDEETINNVKQKLIERHPGLNVFLDKESSFIISIEVESFLLLDGFTDAYYEIPE